MTEPEYKNVVLDAHWYLGMDLGSNLEELDFMRTIFHDHAEKLKLMEQVHPVIVGEWCLCHDSQSKRERTPLQEELFSGWWRRPAGGMGGLFRLFLLEL